MRGMPEWRAARFGVVWRDLAQFDSSGGGFFIDRFPARVRAGGKHDTGMPALPSPGATLTAHPAPPRPAPQKRGAAHRPAKRA